jgi:hypothetical protein
MVGKSGKSKAEQLAGPLVPLVVESMATGTAVSMVRSMGGSLVVAMAFASEHDMAALKDCAMAVLTVVLTALRQVAKLAYWWEIEPADYLAYPMVVYSAVYLAS